MTFRVVITAQAEREMQRAFDWWAEHCSKSEADGGTSLSATPLLNWRTLPRGIRNQGKAIALPTRFAISFSAWVDGPRIAL